MGGTYDLGDLIVEKLRRAFKINPDEFAALKAAGEKNPLKVLVATILSQNTTEKNTFRAISQLESKVGIDPNRLATIDLEELERVIAPAGLQKSKAFAIQAAARVLVEKYGGDINKLLSEGEARVREELGKIKGIGEKTIDVLLANSGFPVVAIDTHVRRVSRRLGLTTSKSYKAIRDDLHRVFRPEKRLEAHLLIIKLGREVCKARAPACVRCPLNDVCKFYLARKEINLEA
ncbi:MAG: endonuclease III [Infirmifilum sp.]